MEVMSYTFYLCLVIIVFSHYVSSQSIEKQEKESDDMSDQNNSEDYVKEVSFSEDTDDQKSSLEEPDDQESSTEEGGERTPATFNWQSGIVPFVIGKNYDPIISQRIRSAMHTIESSSCVVFKDLRRKPPKESAMTWLSIENPDGVRECSHTTMREQGSRSLTKAILVIGYDCMMHRDILHSLLHVLGFRDEVTHAQRDMYIRVMWANIQPKYRKLFWLRMGESPHKMVEYDSMSVMHFHDRAFSVNGGATILPLVPGLIISPSNTLSQIDVMKLRLAFGHECKKRKVGNLLQTCQNALQSGDDDNDDGNDDDDGDDDDGEQVDPDYEGSADPEDPDEPADPEDPNEPADFEDPTYPAEETPENEGGDDEDGDPQTVID